MPYSYEPHHFEDFAVGQEFETIGRTVTETDLVNQASLSGDWSEYHTNETYASENLFGERIAQAPLTISVSMGLMTNAGFLTRTAAGLAGMDETQYPLLKNPFPGLYDCETLILRRGGIRRLIARKQQVSVESFPETTRSRFYDLTENHSVRIK